MIVNIEGNIGAGKSTLATELCEELKRVTNKNVHLIKEPVEEWQNVGGENILKIFYEDMSRWGFTFEVNALLDAVANELRALSYSFDGDIVVMERSSFSVLKLFTKLLENDNYLKVVEAEILKKLGSTLSNFLFDCKNTIVFYLRVDPQVCYERIMKRSRQEEVGAVSLEYLQKLHNIHEQEITAGKVNGKLQVLDGNKSSWQINVEYEDSNMFLNLDISEKIM